MALWKLKVDDYGKIKHAEIEMAPLTLFVGDNNSGKSYLLSLLWGIQNLGVAGLIGNEVDLELKEFHDLKDWFQNQVYIAEEKKNHEVSLGEVSDLLSAILSDRLKKRKNELVRKIFNSEDVEIGGLDIEIGDLSGTVLHLQMDEEIGRLSLFTDEKWKFSQTRADRNTKRELSGFDCWFFIRGIYSCILDIAPVINYSNDYIYLPAARTGFMLTKDIINRVGRENTFNISEEKEQITPFIKPVNQFLDVMSDLAADKKGKPDHIKIIDEMEKEMTEGIVEISSMPGKEVLFVPKGKKKGLPLRIVSAVVTEMSPLMLILKHKKTVERFYYEEPEMCLHPQLQQKMGKIISRIVNSGISMVITTHSDIILQHINNMIKLSSHQECEAICKRMGYDKNDLLQPSQVRVYQLKTKRSQKTEVNELVCGENGFVVSTFNDALDKIMNEAYEIQG